FVSEQGVGFERVVLGGFSQGGVMTYALGLGAGRPRPAGVIALSSFIPSVEGVSLDLSAPLPPVAVGHRAPDNVIGGQRGRRARATLEAAGASVLYRETPMFHQIDPEFVRQIADWLPV